MPAFHFYFPFLKYAYESPCAAFNFFYREMAQPHRNNGISLPFPLVYALTSGAASRFILHEQNLYQISSNSFLVYSNSPGGDKPRPYNWWCKIPTQTLLIANLIPLIFRLQSPYAFRMVRYIVLNYQRNSTHFTGALLSKLPTDRTTEQQAWIRIRANSNQFSLYHSGAPNHPLIYLVEIID